MNDGGVGEGSRASTDRDWVVPAAPRARRGSELPNAGGMWLGTGRGFLLGEPETPREQNGCEQVASSEPLLAAIDDELSAVALATVNAMSALRRLGPGEPGLDELEAAYEAVGAYLTEASRLTRSTLALRLALLAAADRRRANDGADDDD